MLSGNVRITYCELYVIKNTHNNNTQNIFETGNLLLSICVYLYKCRKFWKHIISLTQTFVLEDY